MTIDSYNDWNPNNPINQQESEPLSELEQLQEVYYELVHKVLNAKVKLKECIEILEQTDNTLILNKLKSIKL